MSNSCGAVPGPLISFSSWATGKDANLKKMGDALNQAIEAMRGASQDPQYLTLGWNDFVGNDVNGFSTRYNVTDTWVGQVGSAFLAAAMKDLPPAMRAQYWQSYLNGYVTMSESDIAYVGDEPIVKAQQEGQAVELADQLKEADDAHDGQEIQHVLQQLGQFQNNPDVAAVFFNELGPGYTMQTVELIWNNPDELKTFDLTLAAASNSTSPGLSDDFVNQLWDWNSSLHPPMNAYARATFAYHLLQYGVFGESFLTAAADAYVRNPPGGGVAGTWLSTIMEALSRNPTAATDYLNTSVKGKPMVQYLALLTHNLEYMDNQAGHAFGDMIYSATVTSPWADTYHTKILQDLGNMDWHLMPDGAKESLSKIIAKWAPDLINFIVNPHKPGQDATLSWQANLFREAELLSDGSVWQPSFDNIQSAIGQYVAAGPPAGTSLLTWSDNVGKLYALVSLPVSQSVQMGAGNVNDMLNIGNDATGLVTNFIPPPFGQGAGIIANHVFASIEGGVSNAANAQVGHLEDQTLAAANASVVQQAYQNDPSLVPDSVKAQGHDAVYNYLSNLADPYGDTTRLTPAQQQLVSHIQDMDDQIKDAYTTQNASNY